MCMSVYVSNSKSLWKMANLERSVKKYDGSAKGARWKFLDMLIDHRNL